MNKVSQKYQNIFLHSRPCTCLEYSLDGTLLFTAGMDSKVNVICPYSATVLESYGPHITKTGTAIRTMSVSSDARYIVLGFSSEYIVVHDRNNKSEPVTGKEYKLNEGERVKTVQLSKDSKWMIATMVSGDKTKIVKYAFPEMTPMKEKLVSFNTTCCVLTPDDSEIWFGSDSSIRAISTEDLSDQFDEDVGSITDLQIYKNAFVVCPVVD